MRANVTRGILHDEAEVLTRMHEVWIPEQGLTLTGKHQEVYFSDFRKTAAENLHTLLRQPVII